MGQSEIKELFFENPSKQFYLRQIAKLSNTPKTTAARILRKLSKQGIIQKIKEKPFPKFFANTENPMHGFYKKVFILEKIYSSGLINHLDSLSPKAIILFGSCAKGEYNRDSDIDLFILSPGTKINLEKYEKKLKHSINLVFEQDINNLSNELLNNIINGTKLRGFLKLNERHNGLASMQKRAHKKNRARFGKNRINKKDVQGETEDPQRNKARP